MWQACMHVRACVSARAISCDERVHLCACVCYVPRDERVCMFACAYASVQLQKEHLGEMPVGLPEVHSLGDARATWCFNAVSSV